MKLKKYVKPGSVQDLKKYDSLFQLWDKTISQLSTGRTGVYDLVGSNDSGSESSSRARHDQIGLRAVPVHTSHGCRVSATASTVPSRVSVTYAYLHLFSCYYLFPLSVVHFPI